MKNIMKHKEPKKSEKEYSEKLTNYFNSSIGTTFEKLNNFPKYIPRQALTKFLVKYEIFKKIIDVEGAIVECGIRHGGGLLSFAQMSAIFEPVNYTRKIIGFDTFMGFPNLSKKDTGSKSQYAYKGGFAVDSLEDINKAAELYDENRFISKILQLY